MPDQYYIKVYNPEYLKASFRKDERYTTGPMMKGWIEKELNIENLKTQIYNIIKALWFSYQKSQGFFRVKDIEKQDAFKVVAGMSKQ